VELLKRLDERDVGVSGKRGDQVGSGRVIKLVISASVNPIA
jgi:hypothetical protein